MDKIIIIKLGKSDVFNFCTYCEKINSDIDLIDGSNTLDAKDYEHVLLMDFNKSFCISINSNDEQEIQKFNEIMNEYRVK